MNIFEALRQEHEIQRNLVAKLVETHGDTQERKKIFEQLKHELKIHADAEERHFYIPLIKKDLTQEKARHSVAEHHEMDELIEQLEDTEMDASNWLKIAKEPTTMPCTMPPIVANAPSMDSHGDLDGRK